MDEAQVKTEERSSDDEFFEALGRHAKEVAAEDADLEQSDDDKHQDGAGDHVPAKSADGTKAAGDGQLEAGGETKPATGETKPVTGETKPASDEKESVADDELLTRAVKAGMSLSDARAFSDAGLLARQVSLLESKVPAESGREESGAPKDDANGDTNGKEADDLLSGIDLGDYDEGFAAFITRLVNTVKDQSAELKSLRAGGVSDKADTWLAEKVKGLDAETQKAVTPERQSAIETQMKVLEAGYKALGAKGPDRDRLFDEAFRSAMGADLDKINGKRIAQLAKERSGRAISQPRSVQGRFVEPSSDEEREASAVAAVAALCEDV